ncbi:MAG: HAD family hydrolase [Anaerolineae bacterium]
MKRAIPITTLFLDVGGVLLTNGWGHQSRSLAAKAFDLNLDEMEDRHHLTFDTYEVGKLTLEEYLTRTVFYEERPFTRDQFREFMCAQSQPYPDMIELARNLKAQHELKIAVVNKEARELNSYRIERFKLDEFVDFFISSCFVHFRKPDADIFRLALDIAQVPAEQVVYIDDQPLFVQVAEGLGIHGLSYAYLMGELARLTGTEAARGRIILAHLGNGASLAAVRDGKSVDTSMSFTPTAGVPMSTRSGDLDPGLVWYLACTEKMSAKQFNEMVNFQSGLLGVSETSSDMHDLLERETEDVRAAEAVALFCYQVKKRIGAFAAALGGLDTLVFAGGIGENAPIVRAGICDGLEFLGIELEEKRNVANAGVISTVTSRVPVRVIHTDEEWMIGKTVCRVLGLTVEKEHESKKGV